MAGNMENWGSSSTFFIRLLQLFGYLQINHSTKERKLYHSKLLLFYSFVLLITILSWLIHALSTIKKDMGVDGKAVEQTIDYIHYLGAGIGYFSAVIESIATISKRKEYFENIYEIDQLFKVVLNSPIQKEKHRVQLMKSFIIIALIYISIELYSLAVTLYEQKYIFIHYWILHSLLTNFCAMRYFEVYASTNAFKWRFDQLNEFLGKLKLKNDNEKIIDADRTPIRKFGFYNTEVFLQKKNTENIAFYNFAVLRDIYHRLWELTNTFNDTLGFSLLVNIGCDFLSMTANFYWVFITVGQAKTKMDFLWLGMDILSLIPHIFNVILVSRMCYLTVQSANKTALLVHKMPIDSTNKNHNIAVEQFSLQIMHQRIAFSAFRFFDIDLSLLYAISGAITTYLVILIQFHMSSGRTD